MAKLAICHLKKKKHFFFIRFTISHTQYFAGGKSHCSGSQENPHHGAYCWWDRCRGLDWRLCIYAWASLNWLFRTKWAVFEAWLASPNEFGCFRGLMSPSKQIWTFFWACWPIRTFFWNFVRTYKPDFQKFSTGLVTYIQGSCACPLVIAGFVNQSETARTNQETAYTDTCG